MKLDDTLSFFPGSFEINAFFCVTFVFFIIARLFLLSVRKFVNSNGEMFIGSFLNFNFNIYFLFIYSLHL